MFETVFDYVVGSTVLTAVGEFIVRALANVAVEAPTSAWFWLI